MTGFSLAPAQNICDRDIIAERWRQLRKWGPQAHPDGTGDKALLYGTDCNLDLRTGSELAAIFRRVCDKKFADGRGTWMHILLEEVYEALAESESTALRAELIQVATVCVAWVEDLDNRAGDRAAVPHPLDQLEPVAA